MLIETISKLNKTLIIIGAVQLLLLLIFRSELTNIYGSGFIFLMGIYIVVPILTIYLLIKLAIRRDRSSLKSFSFFLVFNLLYYILIDCFH